MAKKTTTKEQSLRFVIYARKTTESADRQVASLGAQIEVVKDITAKNHYKVVKTFRESASAHKIHNRPKFDEMVKMIESGEANAILCWHANRLVRNPLENGIIHQLLIDRKLRLIHTNDRVYRPEDCAILFMARKIGKISKKLPQKSRGYLTAIYRRKMPKNRLYIPLGGRGGT